MSKECQKKMVLLIEDEANIRNFASRVLELEGYRTLQAENDDEGLRLVREIQIDLILLDLKLIGGDGWSMLQELKNDLELSSVPIIVFTGLAVASQHEKALKMGANDYLVKPVSATTLRETVGQALGLKRRRKQAV